MKPPAPPRVDNLEDYWSQPPPVYSERCQWWISRIEGGWRPGKRVSCLGYYSKAEFYGVYIWEYLNVLSPMLHRRDDRGGWCVL